MGFKKKSHPMLLSPALLLSGYKQGIFPMALETGEIGWFSPDPRGVIPLAKHEFRIPHGLKRSLKNSPFEVRLDSAFAEVVRRCAQREETWINEDIIESYEALFEMGHAHSVETWLNGELVGGLYGVAIHGAFFGESMFHAVPEASKVALVALVERLRTQKFSLLDVQWTTAHLRMFGAIDIPKQEYLRQLQKSLQQVDCTFG